MVQACKFIYQLVQGLANGGRLLHHGAYGHVAQTDDLLPVAVAHHSLGHHAAGIGKVDQPGVGTQLFHIFHDVQNYRDGAERLEDSSGSVGLLSQKSVGEGNPLILDTGI